MCIRLMCNEGRALKKNMGSIPRRPSALWNAAETRMKRKIRRMRKNQRGGVVGKPRKQNPIKWWLLQQHWNVRVQLKLQHKCQAFFQRSVLPMWLASEWVILYEGLQATVSSRKHNIRTAKETRSFFRRFFFFFQSTALQTMVSGENG